MWVPKNKKAHSSVSLPVPGDELECAFTVQVLDHAREGASNQQPRSQSLSNFSAAKA